MNLFSRTWHQWDLDKFVEENPGIPLSSVTLDMWKEILKMENLTDENKTEDEIKSADARYREVYLGATYQPDEVKNKVAVVDNSNNFAPLIDQFAMFPEAGGSHTWLIFSIMWDSQTP